MIVSLIRRGLVALGIALATTAWPASAETVIELEKYAGKLRQVSMRIAGREHKFLFDTGGGHTLISPALASALGCKPAGRILGFRMNGEKFESAKCVNVGFAIGVYASQEEAVGVFYLMTMLPSDFPRLDGLISLASFAGRSVALDLSAGKLVVDPARQGFGQPFPCRVATGVDGADYILFAGVRRARTMFWFEVDSGNLDSVRLAPHTAPYFEAAPGSPLAIDLALGDGRAVKSEARIVDLIHDGALNAAFLEHGVLFADLRARSRCSWLVH
jgi:hypothetical protein